MHPEHVGGHVCGHYLLHYGNLKLTVLSVFQSHFDILGGPQINTTIFFQIRAPQIRAPQIRSDWSQDQVT